MKYTEDKLEQLIEEYETAIFTGDVNRIGVLAIEVEKEADRIGYSNHKRLMSLHSMAERAGG